MNKTLISHPALQNTFLGLGFLLLVVALIGLWGGQEDAVSQWVLGAFLAPSTPSQPHSKPSGRKGRIGPFFIAMAFLVIFSAAASVWLWSRSENYYRDDALQSFLIMLCLGCFCIRFKSVMVNADYGLDLLFSIAGGSCVFSFIFFLTSIYLGHYYSPLSGKDLASMSFSQCEKDRLYVDITIGMHINREKIESISSLCGKEIKKEDSDHEKSKASAEKKKTDLAGDQLKALGF